MNYKIVISRRESAGSPKREETFDHNGEGNLTVADFLTELNKREDILCSDGKKTSPVSWECSCMEQKCGACAMLINDRPTLACSVFLKDAADKNGIIRLAPLSKFPVIRDLKVDRKAIFDMLIEIKAWTDETGSDDNGSGKPQHAFDTHTASKEDLKFRYKSSKCLMCGCCLEICPNYIYGGAFGGAAAMVNAYKDLDLTTNETHSKELKNEYLKHFFNGCGVSLSCKDICPAEIPIDELQSRANAYAAWGKTIRK